MDPRIGKAVLLPAALVMTVAAGSVGGAAAFDHYASIYLWPEPENLVVHHAAIAHDAPARVVTYTSNFPGVERLTEPAPGYDASSRDLPR